MENDVRSSAAYYRTREKAERILAQEAPLEDIQKIHLELAVRYAELAADLETRRPSVTLATPIRLVRAGDQA
jgi:hypothetical protein